MKDATEQPQTQWENVHQLYPSAFSSMPLTHSSASVSHSHTPMSHSVQDSLPLTKHTIYTVQPFVLSNVFEIGFTFCWQAESSYFSCENAAFKGTLTG